MQQSKYVEMLTSVQMDNTLTKKEKQTDCVASHRGRGKAVTGYLLAYQFQPTKPCYFDGIVAQWEKIGHFSQSSISECSGLQAPLLCLTANYLACFW